MSNKAVANKIIEAWKHIGSIPKHGRNPKFNYSFVREEDAADALRNAFIKVGLSCVPSVEKLDRSIIKTSSGSEMQHVIVTMKFTLTDKDTGETDSFTMVGEAADSFDKAVYKAITGCTKYAYVKLAMSGAEDNEDEDSGERAEEKPREQQSQQKPVPQGTTYRKPEQSNKLANQSGDSDRKPAGTANIPAGTSDTSGSGNGGNGQATAPHKDSDTLSKGPEKDGSQIPIMEKQGYITAVIPAMKGKPASLSFKDENSVVLAVTFDPKTVDVPSLLKLQAGKSKVEIRCDISDGNPHLMMVKGV